MHTAQLSWAESRPVMQVMFALRFLACAFLAGTVGLHGQRVTIGLLAWLATCMSVYIFNGLMDKTEDVANGKQRPIASGRLPERRAWWIVAALAVLGLVGGILTGLAGPVLLFLGIGYFYSGPPWPLKKFGVTAALVIGAMGVTTFWAGAIAGGGSNVGVMVYAAVMAAWMGLVGALLKDIPDAPGDAAAGRRTFAVLYGDTVVLRLVPVFAVVMAAGGLAASIAWARDTIPSMAVLAAGATWVAIRCLSSSRDGHNSPANQAYHASFWVQYGTAAAAIGTMLAR